MSPSRTDPPPLLAHTRRVALAHPARSLRLVLSGRTLAVRKGWVHEHRCHALPRRLRRGWMEEESVKELLLWWNSSLDLVFNCSLVEALLKSFTFWRVASITIKHGQ